MTLYSIYPPAPNGYERLKYLESNSHQALVTNLTPSANTYFMVDHDVTAIAANQDQMHGVSAYDRAVLGIAQDGTNYWGFGSKNIYGARYGYATTGRHTMFLNSMTRTFGIDNSTYNYTGTMSAAAGPICLFNRGTSTGYEAYDAPISCKLYKTIICVNGQDYHTLLPMLRKSDRKPGLYDTFSDTFYTGRKYIGSNVNELAWEFGYETLSGTYVAPVIFTA